MRTVLEIAPATRHARQPILVQSAIAVTAKLVYEDSEEDVPNACGSVRSMTVLNAPLQIGGERVLVVNWRIDEISSNHNHRKFALHLECDGLLEEGHFERLCEVE